MERIMCVGLGWIKWISERKEFSCMKYRVLNGSSKILIVQNEGDYKFMFKMKGIINSC
jgi:hypothetical protein